MSNEVVKQVETITSPPFDTEELVRPVKFYDTFLKPMVEMFAQIKNNSREFFKVITW